MENFLKLLRMDAMHYEEGISVEEQVAAMKAADIEKAILIALALGEYDVEYEVVRDVVQQYPETFYAIAGINPFSGMKGVKKLEQAVEKYGFVGAHLYPHWFRRPPNDKIYYPFYAKCCELNVPIQVQIGHAAPTVAPTVAQPILLDEVAIYFPDLKLIGTHIGWPWVEEAIAVAWKHPNVYLASSAHSPRYWPPEFVRYLRTRGREKVLFGTNWPVLQFKRTREEIADLALSEDIEQNFLRDTACRLYGLGPIHPR